MSRKAYLLIENMNLQNKASLEVKNDKILIVNAPGSFSLQIFNFFKQKDKLATDFLSHYWLKMENNLVDVVYSYYLRAGNYLSDIIHKILYKTCGTI